MGETDTRRRGVLLWDRIFPLGKSTLEWNFLEGFYSRGKFAGGNPTLESVFGGGDYSIRTIQ